MVIYIYLILGCRNHNPVKIPQERAMALPQLIQVWDKLKMPNKKHIFVASLPSGKLT
jgi:hypothetical protein